MPTRAPIAQTLRLIRDRDFQQLGRGIDAGKGGAWHVQVKGTRRDDPRLVSGEGSQTVLRWGEIAERVRLVQPLALDNVPPDRPVTLSFRLDLVSAENAHETPLLWAAILRRIGESWQFEHQLRLRHELGLERERIEASLGLLSIDPRADWALGLQFKPEAREVRLLAVEFDALVEPPPEPAGSKPTPPDQAPSNQVPPNRALPNQAPPKPAGERIKLKHFKGKVEEASRALVKGWIAPIDPNVEERPTISLHLDGALYGAVPSFDRADLARNGIPNGTGFRYDNIVHLGAKPAKASLIVDQTGEAISSVFEIEPTQLEARPPAFALQAVSLANAGRRGVSILVPIYNAHEAVRACLSALLDHSQGQARLILLDDASTDPRIAQELARYAKLPGVVVARNKQNLGFTRTVNLGLEMAAGDDIVLLNSDTRVTPRWLQNLRQAAYSSHNVGSATPLSDNAGVFSIAIAALEADGWTDEEIARLVSQSAGRLLPLSPTAHGFCTYFRGDMLEQVGGLDAEAFPRGYGEENDLSMRAGYAGWLNVIDDRTIVFHERSASFGDQKQELLAQGRAVIDTRYPEYGARARALSSDNRLSLAKFMLHSAIAHRPTAGARPRPRILYVIASRSGGTPQTNQDLMGAIAGEVDTWLLHCDTKTVTFSQIVEGAEHVREQRMLGQPIDVRTHRSREYDEAVAEWLDRHQIEMLHIRHIAWHSLGLIDVAARLGIPVIFSFHDYYVSCPTVKLLDESLRHCGGICTSGEGLCSPELWPKAAVPPLKHNWVHNWRRLLLPVLAKCDAFVTTIDSARDVVRRSYPSLAETPFEIIPHGRDFEEMARVPTASDPSAAFRILVPGNIGPQKGGDIIAGLAALCAGTRMEVHIAGRVSGLLSDAPVTFHGQYQRGEFTRLAETIRPAVGAVLSIWPETYCHTLTELWAAGIPVIGFDLGAVGERIRETGAGWAIPVGDAASVLEALQRIASDPDDYRRKLDAVAAWQAQTGTHYGTAEMGRRYLALYAQVRARHRAFGRPVVRPEA